MTLAAVDVSAGFGGEPVLRDVTLDVSPGETVALVGPSGTGKTTLLRLFAGFRPPDAGTVQWEDDDIWEFSEQDRLAVRRRVSMVFQEPSLFNAPVARNVTYGTRVRRPWPDRIVAEFGRLFREATLPEAAADALETVGLGDKIHQNALSLSAGEAQRVAFARALAVDPDVMLLDEPTSNLDPRNTAVLEHAVSRARDRGVGVLVATHDMHQAERIADRVAVMLDGTLAEVGPAERVFAAPTDPRTARFIDGELLYEPEDAPPASATAGTPSSHD